MPFAAVPDYLGDDFKAAAPGHRFYLYFPVWSRGPKGTLTIQDRDKARAVEQILPLNDNDKATLAALAARQQAMADARARTSGPVLWQLPAKTVAPLTTGLGLEHPLENGFAFLNPYGLPYLPGSGIKGVLRAAARELRDDEPETGWTDELIDTLFGPETGDNEENTRRGALIFWDALPVIHGNRLTAEVMTPHQGHYYEGKAPPHDSGQPNPILFLAIPPGSTLNFFVDCNRRLLPESFTDDDAWQKPLRAAFEYAFDWLGFGAKTAVGYGHLEIDTRAEQDRAEQQAERAAEQAKQSAIDEATQNLAEDAAQLVRRRENTDDWSNNGVFLDAMEEWLAALPGEQLSPAAWDIVAEEMGERFKGDILADPDATNGKKQKPKYSGRQKILAKNLLAIQPKDHSG